MTHHPTDGSAIAADAHYGRDGSEPNYECAGCQGGDKWPASEAYWLCPVCDTEYFDTDEPDGDHLYEQARDRAMERDE